MREITRSGELQHLAAERIWREFERAMETLRARLRELNENTEFTEGQAVELVCAEFLGAM